MQPVIGDLVINVDLIEVLQLHYRVPAHLFNSTGGLANTRPIRTFPDEKAPKPSPPLGAQYINRNQESELADQQQPKHQ